MALLTLDSNLAKAADLSGVRVLNLHTLALALRPPVIVGEDVSVQLSKPGRESWPRRSATSMTARWSWWSARSRLWAKMSS